MPTSPPAAAKQLCGFARIAKRPRQLRVSVAACLSIFINVGAAQAATNLPDGEWYVAVSCEQDNRSRAFSFREQVSVKGGEFSLTVHVDRFTHEFSGSIKDDRVRITGLGKLSSTSPSTDRVWRFSGRASGSPDIRIKGTMNGRDVGAMFYQDCEVFMSPVDTVASVKGPSQPNATGSESGLTTRTWTQSGGALRAGGAPEESPLPPPAPAAPTPPSTPATATQTATSASVPIAEPSVMRPAPTPTLAAAKPSTAEAGGRTGSTASAGSQPASLATGAMTLYRCAVPLEYEYWPDVIPELTKACLDASTALETCTSFSFHAKAYPKKYAYTDSTAGIKKSNGALDFKPVGLKSYDVSERGALSKRWVLYLIDNSGSPTRSEERIVVIDDAFKPLTSVMSYAEASAYFKKRNLDWNNLNDEPLDCKPVKPSPSPRSGVAQTKAQPKDTARRSSEPRPSFFKPGDFWETKDDPGTVPVK